MAKTKKDDKKEEPSFLDTIEKYIKEAYKKAMGDSPAYKEYKTRYQNKGGYIGKPRKGHTDYRFNKGGMVMSSTNNMKKK